MGMTTVEKILANHSDQSKVSPGDVVVVDVDVAVFFDWMRPDVLKVFDPDRLVLLHDHQVPAPTVRAANMAKQMRAFVEKFKVKHYFPVGQHGISHVLVAQEGSGPTRPDPGQSRFPYLLVRRTQLPGPRHGPVGDDLHPLQRQDLVHGRSDHQGEPGGQTAQSGSTHGTSSTTSRVNTAISPAETSSGTEMGSPVSGWTAA